MGYNVLSGSVSNVYNINVSGTFTGSFGGDGTDLINVKQFDLFGDVGSGKIAIYKTVNSKTQLQGDSNLFYDVTNDVLTVSKMTASSDIHLSGLSNASASAQKYLALDSNNNVVLTSSSGGGGGGDGTIGAAEDGSYTDGLFTDFTNTTPIGTPVDRFNEVLKILAPSPAPALSRINYDVSNGVTAKLSFGSSSAIAGYTSSATAAGFTAVDVTGSYGPATSGNNFRLGIYDGTQDITGFLNFDVVESVQNNYLAYSNDAFGNAETGSLKLELNGTVIHTVALNGFAGSGNPNTGSANSLTGDSGFTNVSVTASSFDGNNSEWYIFKHRTAKYKIDTNQQKVGWNYARAIHSLGGTDYATNYVEWINDPSGAVNDLSITNPRIENITLVGSKYLSGVEYNTDVTAKYKANINNLYRNIYAASGTPITFTVTNSSTPSAQSVPDIGAGQNNTKILGITGSLDYNGTSLLNGAITCNVSVTHPLKSTISNTGSATTGNGFLIDNRSLASSNLIEKFHDETYRKTSGSYDTQTATTSSNSNWNSQNHMTGGGAAGHTDGLLFFNQRLYSPIDSDIPASGDFASLSNVESGQPDYSGISGTRTFYRIISNSSGVTKRDLKITSTKNSTTYNNSSLGTNNAHFFVKIPGATGWMDISQDFTYGSVGDGNGALIDGASNDVDSGNNVHHVTFGTASVSNGNRVMIKVLADESWAGYISQISFSLGATTNTATQAPNLDDIDADFTGTDAKLSFGSSNTIADYSNATGSSISLTNFNSNGNYTVSGDRRGIFSSKQPLTGTLNEDVSSNGNNYPANSFFNGYSGSLVLEVNGSDAHTISLSQTLSSINTTGSNGSRLSVGAVSFSTTSDNIPDYTKPYRTGTYSISPLDQNVGWNYARVKHGGVTTNYVEWIVDPSGSVNDTAVSTPTLSNFNHTSVYYQSGIGYFASNPSGSFTFSGSNFYRNVYSNASNAIRFPTTTNCSVTNIRVSGSGITTFDSSVSQTSMPALNNTSGCETKDIQVTGTLQYDGSTPSISGGLSLFTDRDVTATGRIIHPFKTNKTTNSASKTSFMIYSGAVGSTTQQDNEYYNTETYRIVSGNYASQTSLTSSANAWNSSTAMNNGGTHDDGMVTVNGYLISPKQIGNSGDTRNVADGGSLQSPSSNPNYSSLTKGTRTFYRYFNNNTVNDRSSITITLFGSGSLVKKATSLGANGNFYVEAKIPGKTAWLDVGTAYSSNNPLVNGAGALDGADPGNPAINIAGGGTSVVCNFNGQSLLGTGTGPDYFALKISSDEDWLGYLTRVRIQYS